MLVTLAFEKDGIDYYFISAEEFKQRIEKDEFAEWEQEWWNRCHQYYEKA